MRKFFKRYGATVLFYGGILAIFVFGFVLGAYGKSAPNAETAEFYNDRVINVADVKSEETHTETEAPKYTEITVTATAYCACEKCCGKTDGITATGTKATAGRTIAVDPKVIPYGTNVIIEGVTYIAEDCGGAVKGNDIDIFFNTHEETLNFGKQILTAYIPKGGKE